jgi:lipoprotein-releasing system ATP-binding protein
MNIVLELKDVHKRFAGAESDVLSGVNLAIAAQESVAILGPSGSGKTTLLQIAGLLDTPTSGSVHVGGNLCSGQSERHLTRIRREFIGFVYQFHNLMPDMTALENVMLPMMIMRRNALDSRIKASRVLQMLGIGPEKFDRKPKALSGGENQRVAIARAFVKNPRILLADEPTGNLDEENASVVANLLLQLANEYGTASLIITHNEQLARKLDRFLLLQDKKLVG